MSTPIEPTPPQAIDSGTKPAKAKRTRREKWRRRFFVFITSLVLLGLAFRILLHVLFPIALDRVARLYGLDAQYDKLDLSVLGADVGIWGLRFTPIDGGEPVIATYYCRGAISTFGLLKLQLHVQRVEAEDAQVLIERLPDGTLPLVERLLGATAAATPVAPATKSTDPASLDAPLTIDALRLQNARARVRDGMMVPATDVTLQMDLLVRDVGSSQRPTRVELQLNSPETLAALYVNAEGTSRNNQIDADLSVQMVGLNLQPARAYLEPLGIAVQSQDISASAHGKLRASLTKAAPATQPTTRATMPTTLPAAGTLQASLSLDDIVLTADAIEAAGVRQLVVDAREVSPGAVRIDRIDLKGVRANVARTEAGLIAFAGIEVGSGSAAPKTAPTTRPMATTTVAASGGAMPSLEVDRFEVSDVDLKFVDRALTPANAIALRMPQLLIEQLSTDPARAGSPARLTLRAGAPGLAKQIDVSGQIAAASVVKSAAFQIGIDGINADAIGPYLRPFGIDESFTDASFKTSLNATFETKPDGVHHASFELVDARLVEAEQPLVEMSRVAITDASFDPSRNALRFDNIELLGPALPIRREADGSIHLLGFHTLIAAAPSQSATAVAINPSTGPTTAITAEPSPASALPSVEIGKLVWRGSKITLSDRATGGEPINLVLDDVTAGIEDLTLAAGGTAKPGKVMFALRAPGLVETLDVTGTITPSSEALAFTFRGDSTGITLDRVRSLLVGLNLESTMKAGAFHVEADGSVRNQMGVYRADIAVRDASLNDGDTRWLGLTSAAIRNVTFDGKRVGVEAFEVDSPQALVQRDEAGALTAAGIKLLPPRPVAPVVGGPPAAPATTRVDLSLPIVGQIHAISVKQANVRFEDAATLPASNVSAVVTVDVKGVVVGEDAPPATYAINVTSPGVIDRLDVNGTFKLAPQAQSLTAVVAGNGLRGTAIEAYLPPTIGIDLGGRNVAATLSASLAQDARGGSNGSIELKDARITTADGSSTEVGVRLLRTTVDRIDLPGKVIAVDELAVEGAQLLATQSNDGLHLLGVTLSPTPLRAVRPSTPTAEPIASVGAADVAALVQAAEEAMPLISVKSMRLGADRLSFVSPALGEPLTVTNASLTNNAEPILLGGPTPADHPPIHLIASAGVEHLIGAITSDVRLTPFANEPSAQLTLDVDRVDGSRLTTLVPSIADLVDAGDLRDAHFATAADARFKFSRRGPLGIDLTRDVTADFSVRDTKLTVAGSDRPLVGVGEVRGEKIRYSPASGSLVVGTLEIAKPIASVVREADGVHIAGLTLKVLQPQPAATTQPATDAVATPTAPPEPTPVAAVSTDATPTKAGSGEVRIDRLAVSGVDFRIEDRVNKPFSILPIADLDVEVVGLSTRALTEPRPIRFSAVVAAGKAPLPPRKLTIGVETEERDVFAEASANGNLTLVPKPSGYVRGSISGLELTAIRGLASEYGITLGGGTFDGRLDVRMASTDTFEAKVWPTFNELRMKEIPDGPIQSTFQLPVPPDVAISTLEDVDGSLTFPLSIPIEAGKLDVGAIVGSAVGSIGKVLTEAMVAAPLKALKLAGMAAGFDMSSDRTKGLEPIAIDFASGESQLTSEQVRALQTVRNLMRHDPTIQVTIQHELGSDDVALADTRVNLGVDDSGAIAGQLRARKYELQRLYAEQSAELITRMATQETARIEPAQARLRETATQLKVTEDGLDSIFDLLRPGADRQASRRARAASILLADLRLRSVQDWLLTANVRDAGDRVRRSSALFNPVESGPGRVRIVLTRQAKS